MKTVSKRLIAGLVIAPLVGCVTPDNVKSAAEANMNVFAEQAGLQPIQCSSFDSDGDGYVSCTVMDRQSKQMITLDCLYFSQGCRIQPLKYPIQ